MTSGSGTALNATIPPLPVPRGYLCDIAKNHVHETHTDIVVPEASRSPAQGHRDVRGRPVLPRLAQQFHAVEKAIGEAKKTLIHDHVDHCLDTVTNGRPHKSTRAVLTEFMAISRYLYL